jgi:formylglycine-generating enzyme required for sulfatase activity
MDSRLTAVQRRLLEDPADLPLWLHYASLLARLRPRGDLALLSDLEAWRKAEPEAQDRLAAQLALALATDYDWLGMRSGATGLRLAWFQHRRGAIPLVLIPSGSVTIGSERGDDESPPHQVKLAPFLLGREPVSEAQLARASAASTKINSHQPVAGWSWYAARVWLTRAGGALRMPSEQEWEYACRAGDGREFPCGPAFRPECCWTRENAGGAPHPAREHEPSPHPFGLIDLGGNLWEWCEDNFKDYARGRPPPEDRAWRLHGLRGGSYLSDPKDCRCARRASAPARSKGKDFGLRVARDLPPLT